MRLLFLCCSWLRVSGQPNRVNYLLPGEEHIPFLFKQHGVARSRNEPKSFELNSHEFDLNTIIVDANFTTTYSRNVSLQQQYLFIYSYNETNIVRIF